MKEYPCYSCRIKLFLKKIVLYLLLPAIFNSCMAKWRLKNAGIFDERVSVRTLSNDKKELIFMPMHHIGKQAFYDDVKSQIDSLHKTGYIVFFELITLPHYIDSFAQDTLLRKYRKIVDSFAGDGYINKENGSLLGRKFKFLKDMVNQPRGRFIGIDPSLDRNVDAVLDDLINAYENKYTAVALEKYDFDTNLTDAYHGKKNKNKKALDYFLVDYRNKVISEEIMNAPESKIILVYGEGHYRGIFKYLHLQDPGWHKN